MDLSSYTPIYVRTTGDDANDGLTVGSPKCMAQSAYDAAVAAGTGNYVLDFGAGSFGMILLAANWPARIALRGAGATSSFLGGINGAGIAAGGTLDDDGNFTAEWDSSAGYNIELVGDGISLGAISTSGGNGSSTDFGWGSYPLGRDGGSINITGCSMGAVSSSGGYGWSTAGNAGSIELVGCQAGDIYAAGGALYAAYYYDTPSSGNNVALTDSTSGAISTPGGYTDASWDCGPAGNTTIHGHFIFHKGTTYNTLLVIGSDWIAPDILGAGLL